MRRVYPSVSQKASMSTLKRDKPFEKILVANRGEIACRIIRTAKRLGIKTVAIYSTADGNSSLHAKMADEAYQVGYGPSPMESYLLQNDVLDIAKRNGVEAIHPGYGFLSENSGFASATESAGMTFIGPGSKAILAMGSKSHSKRLMEDANVPTTPGYHGLNQNPEFLLHEAMNIGFPLLIKATMGGGGKGMRLVLKENEFLESLESCKRESQAAFGDTNVILEKYLIHPRHIEVQIMADTHGNAVYLHERDCSLQRRHQKIIEEAPASDLPNELRKMMGETSIQAVKAIDYVNAGTIEFLLDTQSDNGDFYFCEMNTRLQVEHPVTELITQQDLVEWQLRIAAGEELPIKDQSLIPCVGNAMEARIYAENPMKNFLPVTGQVWHHKGPVDSNLGGNDVRVDTGLESGKDISVYYDPMVSKLIVHGKDREEARLKLIESLSKYQIAGVPSNIPFLIKCAAHPVFARAGAINTGFLEHYAEDVKVDASNLPELNAICAAVASLRLEGRDSTLPKRSSPWSKHDSWRLGSNHERKLKIIDDVEASSSLAKIKCKDGSYSITIGDDKRSIPIEVEGVIGSDDKMTVTLNGSEKRIYTAKSIFHEKEGYIEVLLWSSDSSDSTGATRVCFEHPLHEKRASNTVQSGMSHLNSQLKSPMPGKITRLNFSEGDMVKDSDVIIVMEAMKMEHALSSKMSGVLSSLNCKVGDIVSEGDVLAVLGDDYTKMTDKAA